MKYSALLICFFIFITVQPVNAADVDSGVEMIAKGIDAYVQLRAEKNLDQNFGVYFANTSDADLTPSQKLVYMIAAAEQHPLKIKHVRDTIASEATVYYLLVFTIIGFTFILEILQKLFPEKIAGIFHAFTGHENSIDYSVMFLTSLKLGLLPVIAFPILEFFMSLEQMLSSGLMMQSIEFVSFSTESAGVWFFESIAYSLCGALFAIRIQYINTFYAHIFIVIILLSVIFSFSQKLGYLLCAWFLTTLFVRPVVLWYSCEAVKDIQSMNGVEAVLATAADMSVVVILSFVTVVMAITWPIFMVILKIISEYISFAIYKGNKISRSLGVRK